MGAAERRGRKSETHVDRQEQIKSGSKKLDLQLHYLTEKAHNPNEPLAQLTLHTRTHTHTHTSVRVQRERVNNYRAYTLKNSPWGFISQVCGEK